MMTEQIRIALVKKNMTLKSLAAKLGCTSQNLSGKLKRDNFSENELHEIADAMDCIFEGYFVRKDTKEKL